VNSLTPVTEPLLLKKGERRIEVRAIDGKKKTNEIDAQTKDCMLGSTLASNKPLIKKIMAINRKKRGDSRFRGKKRKGGKVRRDFPSFTERKRE